MKSTKKAAPKAGGRKATSTGLSAEERAALRETIKERKAAAQGANNEQAVLAKIAAMPEPDRALGKKVHAIVRAAAPSLQPKLWYGMPAYANDAGHVVCFFQDAAKFKARYATFGFNDRARLDEGAMWPTSFALTKLTAADEAKIAALVRKAVR